MKKILAGLTAVALLGTGCAVVVPTRSSRSAVTAQKKCPPGHQWSDGRCHAKGKGHDPAK